jgi:glycerol-3-phosphate acyltransferase PlsY
MRRLTIANFTTSQSAMDLVYSYSALLIAYLVGSLSFAVIVSRVMGLSDPRSYGSKNPGATNVLRSGNKLAAVLTLLLDALKGYAPVALVQYYGARLGFEDTTLAFVGFSAFLGHLFPVFFRFQGGKGVATAAGVLLAFEPLLGLATLVTWVAVAALFRYASLASMVAALLAPFFMLLFFDRPMLAMAVSAMGLLLIWRHWRNLVNLIAGKESRIGEKADPTERKRRRRIRHKHDDRASSSSSHR